MRLAPFFSQPQVKIVTHGILLSQVFSFSVHEQCNEVLDAKLLVTIADLLLRHVTRPLTRKIFNEVTGPNDQIVVLLDLKLKRGRRLYLLSGLLESQCTTFVAYNARLSLL